jgi:hypothetical protein
MKKFIFILLLLPGAAFAQLSFGVKAGLNLNDVYMKVPQNFYGNTIQGDGIDPNLGFHLGVFAKIDLSKKFAFIPELQYIRKGFDFSNTDDRLNLNYLELPLMFSYSPIKLIGIELGPGIAYQLAANVHTSSHTIDMSDWYDEKFDVNLNVGVRVYLTQRFSVGARYSYGFTSISQIYLTYDGIRLENTDEYNRNASLSVYYKVF